MYRCLRSAAASSAELCQCVGSGPAGLLDSLTSPGRMFDFFSECLLSLSFVLHPAVEPDWCNPRSAQGLRRLRGQSPVGCMPGHWASVSHISLRYAVAGCSSCALPAALATRRGAVQFGSSRARSVKLARLPRTDTVHGVTLHESGRVCTCRGCAYRYVTCCRIKPRAPRAHSRLTRASDRDTVDGYGRCIPVDFTPRAFHGKTLWDTAATSIAVRGARWIAMRLSARHRWLRKLRSHTCSIEDIFNGVQGRWRDVCADTAADKRFRVRLSQ